MKMIVMLCFAAVALSGCAGHNKKREFYYFTQYQQDVNKYTQQRLAGTLTQVQYEFMLEGAKTMDEMRRKYGGIDP